MKVLLTGAAGQLDQALIASRPPGVELIACGRAELDLDNAEACRAAVKAHWPHWVLNAGAYMAVDRAESEPELALAVNAGARAAFAAALVSTGGRLLQVSTDFVFNGQQGSPYQPEQPVDPLGVYGATKAAGEAAALRLPGARVLRTSWVYGPVGQNFCRTMLRLHCEREQLGVVAAIRWAAPPARPRWRKLVGGPSVWAWMPPLHRRRCFLRNLPFYDHIFSTKQALRQRLEAAGTPITSWLPFAYDPALHRPPAEPADASVDVVFIGTGARERLPWLEALSPLPGVSRRLHGNGWHGIATPGWERCGAITGEAYNQAITSARVVLGLLRQANKMLRKQFSTAVPIMEAARVDMLAFLQFQHEHWRKILSTNPHECLNVAP